jgi:hypothetical protein
MMNAFKTPLFENFFRKFPEILGKKYPLQKGLLTVTGRVQYMERF